MNDRDTSAEQPQGTRESLEGKASSGAPPGISDLDRTRLFGEQFVGFIRDVTDMARMEALLAVKSMPKLVMLWFLMMPVILLTWCSFSVMVAWAVYSFFNSPGFGVVTFFVMQLLLLIVCRWRYAIYRKRMTLPYTRHHLGNFIRGFADESANANAGKKSPIDEA